MTKVFIDGSAGTTGLRIYERIGARKEIELIKLSEERRKDSGARAAVRLSFQSSSLNSERLRLQMMKEMRPRCYSVNSPRYQ